MSTPSLLPYQGIFSKAPSPTIIKTISSLETTYTRPEHVSIFDQENWILQGIYTSLHLHIKLNLHPEIPEDLKHFIVIVNPDNAPMSYKQTTLLLKCAYTFPLDTEMNVHVYGYTNKQQADFVLKQFQSNIHFIGLAAHRH